MKKLQLLSKPSLHLTLGLGVVGGFGKRPPGTEADALLMYKIR